MHFFLTTAILFSEKVHNVMLEEQNNLFRYTQFIASAAFLLPLQKELQFFHLNFCHFHYKLIFFAEQRH